jgi:hypothetical protein
MAPNGRSKNSKNLPVMQVALLDEGAHNVLEKHSGKQHEEAR